MIPTLIKKFAVSAYITISANLLEEGCSMDPFSPFQVTRVSPIVETAVVSSSNVMKTTSSVVASQGSGL